MPLKVYLIRHGETEWNRKGKIQGQADIPLNEAGESLAKLTGKAMAEIPFDRAFTSPLIRAKRTAELILENRPAVSLAVDQRLREISYGKGEGQPLWLIHACPFLKLHRFFAAPSRYKPPEGGESFQALRARCVDFFQNVLLPLAKQEEHVLIAAHGAFIRESVCMAAGIPREDFWKGCKQANCAVTVLQYESGHWRVLEEGVVYGIEMKTKMA